MLVRTDLPVRTRSSWPLLRGRLVHGMRRIMRMARWSPSLPRGGGKRCKVYYFFVGYIGVTERGSPSSVKRNFTRGFVLEKHNPESVSVDIWQSHPGDLAASSHNILHPPCFRHFHFSAVSVSHCSRSTIIQHPTPLDVTL